MFLSAAVQGEKTVSAYGLQVQGQLLQHYKHSVIAALCILQNASDVFFRAGLAFDMLTSVNN